LDRHIEEETGWKHETPGESILTEAYVAGIEKNRKVDLTPAEKLWA
jgi:hypothetical protein